MKTWIQSILLLGNSKQKVVTDGYPYLLFYLPIESPASAFLTSSSKKYFCGLYFTIPFSRYSARFIFLTSEAALSAATFAISCLTISSTSCSKVVV